MTEIEYDKLHEWLKTAAAADRTFTGNAWGCDCPVAVFLKEMLPAKSVVVGQTAYRVGPMNDLCPLSILPHWVARYIARVDDVSGEQVGSWQISAKVALEILEAIV